MRDGNSLAAGLMLLALIASVSAPTEVLAQACGNRAVEGDEDCDDGNIDGGDGCASNCTAETRRPCYFTQAVLTHQLALAPLETPVRGVQVLTIGRARASNPSGEIPYVVRADDITFEDRANGLFSYCSCVKAVPDAALGPGIVARGRIGCGAGLAPVNYMTTIDHNSHLASPDPDPQCLNGVVEVAPQPHPGACNGMPLTEGDGDGPTGSITALYSLTNYFISSTTLCDAVASGAPDRPQGADGIACTADDPQWSPMLLTATTGSATTRLLHLANNPTAELVASDQGTPLSCPALDESDPDRAFEGVVLVASASSELDAVGTGDRIGTFRFICSAAPPTATPTSTSTPGALTATPTVTPTRTVTASITAGTPTQTATPADESPTITPTNTGNTCGGDCDGNGQVRVDELVRGVNIALDRVTLDTCPSFDANGDLLVRVNELVTAVNNLLGGCG